MSEAANQPSGQKPMIGVPLWPSFAEQLDANIEKLGECGALAAAVFVLMPNGHMALAIVAVPGLEELRNDMQKALVTLLPGDPQPVKSPIITPS